MDWRSFIAGLIVGWLIELVIDWFYWRRSQADATTIERLQAELVMSQAYAARQPTVQTDTESLRSELAEAHVQMERLQAELATSQADLSRQTTVQTDAESLRSELATRQTDATNLAAAQAEMEQLRVEVAEHQACAENLAAARAEIEGLRHEVARLQPLEPSDLKRVEGIGGKIEGLLNDAGILTFQQLATTDTERLQMILRAAGERYRLADPSSWPEQARLAADEKWDELSQLQDELKSGRQRPPGQGGAAPL